MIKFTHISKKYDNGNYGLKDVSFKIEQGEFVYVVGKSGAGKSTLLKMFNREDMPTSGEILMGNVKISRLKNNQVYKLRRQVGVIRQKDLFLPNRSAYERRICSECVRDSKRRMGQADFGCIYDRWHVEFSRASYI